MNRKHDDNNILQLKDPKEYEWIDFDAVLGSAAMGTISLKAGIGGNEIRQTEISRRNGRYTSADGGILRNEAVTSNLNLII